MWTFDTLSEAVKSLAEDRFVSIYTNSSYSLDAGMEEKNVVKEVTVEDAVSYS